MDELSAQWLQLQLLMYVFAGLYKMYVFAGLYNSALRDLRCISEYRVLRLCSIVCDAQMCKGGS